MDSAEPATKGAIEPFVALSEPGALPPGHPLWPINIYRAIMRWWDAHTQERYAKKGY